MVCSGRQVTGSTIIPDSERLTLSTSRALVLDREVLVDDPEAALLGHGDRETRLGDGVHGGRDDRDVQADLARQARAQVDLAGMDFGVGRKQQDVVERQRQRDFVVALDVLASRCHQPPAACAPWHFLYFLPEPQGHGSLRPTLG